jgi:hypothetical protein
MEFMKRTNAMWMALVVLSALVVTGSAWADDDDGPMTNMRFVVIRDFNGKPVKNAAVILHPVTSKGKQARGGLELKTDSEGKTNIDGIPYGPIRIQVLAPGFQTFGEDYQLEKPETEIVVKLKRPGTQYSLYENHAESKKPEEKKPEASHPTPDAKKAADEKKASDPQPSDQKPDDTKGDQKPQQ